MTCPACDNHFSRYISPPPFVDGRRVAIKQCCQCRALFTVPEGILSTKGDPSPCGHAVTSVLSTQPDKLHGGRSSRRRCKSCGLVFSLWEEAAQPIKHTSHGFLHELNRLISEASALPRASGQ